MTLVTDAAARLLVFYSGDGDEDDPPMWCWQVLRELERLAVGRRRPASRSRVTAGQWPIEVHHDPVNHIYWVPVAEGKLIERLESEWSEPLQVRIVDGQMTFRRPE